MAICLIIVAALVGSFQADWKVHQVPAWTAVVFVWLYVGFFGASWGPVSWVVISEVFPLSVRGHGVALGASTNWMTK
jgi:MFS family permease